MLTDGVAEIMDLKALGFELDGFAPSPPTGLQTRQGVRPLFLASVTVVPHPVFAYLQEALWYLAPVLVTKTFCSFWAEAEQVMRRKIMGVRDFGKAVNRIILYYRSLAMPRKGLLGN